MFEGKFLIFGLFNLVILALGLVYYFRRPIRKFFTLRSTNLQDRKIKAFESLATAETEYSLYFSHLQNINQEMKKLMEDAELAGEQGGLKLLYDMERSADRIISQSMTRADHEVKRRNVKFYKDVVYKSIDRAEELVKEKLTVEKQIELGRDFLRRLCDEGKAKLGAKSG